MLVTCSLEEIEAPTGEAARPGPRRKKNRVKGVATCSHCGKRGRHVAWMCKFRLAVQARGLPSGGRGAWGGLFSDSTLSAGRIRLTSYPARCTMQGQDDIINTGLRDVIVASTRISDVNGKVGKLIYRGYLIQDLARQASFEEVVYLLLREKLPDSQQLEKFKDRLAASRALRRRVIHILKNRPREALPMEYPAGRCGRCWPRHDPDLHQRTRETSLGTACRLTAQFRHPSLRPGIVSATVKSRWNPKRTQPCRQFSLYAQR